MIPAKNGSPRAPPDAKDLWLGSRCLERKVGSVGEDRVGVVIPVYNTRKLCLEAARSARAALGRANNIVIVDDTEINVLVMEALVGKIDSCQAVPFSDPLLALDWCRANDPDLMVVDYMMPGLDLSLIHL